MKFRVTMKNPDALQDAVEEAAVADASTIPNLDEDEREDVIKIRMENASKLCRKWFKYGEYLTVEIDTEAGTAVVCEAV